MQAPISTLEQITFKTLHSAWPAKMNFAYASRAAALRAIDAGAFQV
jgi:hypothetical protein